MHVAGWALLKLLTLVQQQCCQSLGFPRPTSQTHTDSHTRMKPSRIQLLDAALQHVRAAFVLELSCPLHEVVSHHETVAALTDLVHHETPWRRTPAQQQASSALKSVVSKAGNLAIPDPHKRVKVSTDATDFAIGAVLEQDGKPVAFELHNLSPAERWYRSSFSLVLHQCCHGLRLRASKATGLPSCLVTAPMAKPVASVETVKCL